MSEEVDYQDKSFSQPQNYHVEAAGSVQEIMQKTKNSSSFKIQAQNINKH